MRQGVRVKQPEPPAPPIEREVLAEAIVRISAGIKHLQATGLNERGIIVLLADRTGYSKTICAKMLGGLADLEAQYCRPTKSTK